LLLVAAALKTLSPAESLALEAAYGLPQWVSVALLAGEWVLGLLLVAGVWPRLATGFALVAFTAFGMFSLYRGLSGAESCDCFGAIKISPWFTFVLDVVIVGALGRAWLRLSATELPPAQDVGRSNWRQAAVPSACAIVGALVLAWTVHSQPTRLAAGGELLEGDGLVVLEPEAWLGKPFPLAPYIRETRLCLETPARSVSEELALANPQKYSLTRRVGEDQESSLTRRVGVDHSADLRQGDWIVLLYHHDCPKCQEALPQYEQLAEELQSIGSSERVILVEVPPYAPHTPLPVPHRDRERSVTACNYARLSDEREWFVQAPAEIRLVDGKVVASSIELPALAASDALVDRWALFEH
jgi:hypothetical protein